MGESGGSSTEQLVRIVVADGDPLARHALRAALGADAELAVAAEARTGREAVDAAVKLRPDVVVLDADIPEGDGVLATTLIVRRSPTVRVLVLTRDDDDVLALHVLRAGASGFLRKDMEPDALARAVRGLCAGEAAISRTLARKVIDRLRSAPERGSGMRPVHSTLTTREWQVLDLLCDGASTADIAEALVLTPDTVRTHVKHVLSKLGAHTREEAVAAAATLRMGGDAGQLAPLDELTQRRLAARNTRSREL
jgi:DNA-binding NarL/FixJ family response regulator